MKSDKFRKDFNTWDQFVVMVFAQITGQHGLRSIENAMNCQMSSFYHLGLSKEIKRSTISYANKNHGSEFFDENYFTNGMLTLVDRAFWHLGGSGAGSSVFLLSQAMGGGKTHSMIALGLLARDPELLEIPAIQSRAISFDGFTTNIKLWTDDYSNLFQILK